jgi:hypothetical protein
VTIGDEVVTLSAGSSYFAPRGVPQRLRNRGSVPMHGIVIGTPGGFDEFIAKAGVPLAAGAPMPPDVPPDVPPTPEQIAGLVALAREYGIEILVPPSA